MAKKKPKKTKRPAKMATKDLIKVIAKLFECRDGMMLREEFDAVIKRIMDDDFKDYNRDYNLETILLSVQAHFELTGMKVKRHSTYGGQSPQDMFTYHTDIYHVDEN